MFILEIEGGTPALPRFVGPFGSSLEARIWIAGRLQSGSYSVLPVTMPASLDVAGPGNAR